MERAGIKAGKESEAEELAFIGSVNKAYIYHCKWVYYAKNTLLLRVVCSEAKTVCSVVFG
jgi:hypothetical protein